MFMNSDDKKKYLQNKIFGEALNKSLLWCAFVIYLVLLVWLIAFKCNKEWVPKLGAEMRKLSFTGRVKYIPFYDINKHKFYFTWDFVLNFFLYIPMGIYLMYILKQKKWICILIIFLSSLAFEMSQYFTGFGGCDINDLICNTAGGCIGVLLCVKLSDKVKPKFVNIANLYVCILAMPCALYGIINTILHWQLYVIFS